MKKYIFCAALCALCVLNGADWRKAALLHYDFEGPLPAGIKAEGQPKSVPGLSGKGLRLTRGAWNSIYFFRQNSETLAIGVCPGLSVARPNSASFSACGKGEVTLTIRSGAKTETRSFKVDSSDWKFFNTVFTVPEELGTVTFQGKNVRIKETQVTAGWSFPACYTAPGKVIPGGFLTVDPAKVPLNLDKGAFALWIKTPYLDDRAVMDHIGIFGIDHALKPIKRHPDNQIGCVTAWNGRNLTAYRLSAEGNSSGLTIPLNELRFKADEWHHILVNWERKGNTLTIELILDGGKIKLRNTKPYGKDKKMTRITVGYSDYAALNGDADELAFFNRPLTLKEAKELFEAKGNWK